MVPTIPSLEGKAIICEETWWLGTQTQPYCRPVLRAVATVDILAGARH